MCSVPLLIKTDRRHPFINRAGILPCAEVTEIIDPARKRIVPPRRPSQTVRLLRASCMISNCTGLPVFCWMMVARSQNDPALIRSPIVILTRSQPRNLLSIAKSNSARSRRRLCSSRQKRIAQISRSFKGRFCPTFWPAFQGHRPSTRSRSQMSAAYLNVAGTCQIR